MFDGADSPLCSSCELADWTEQLRLRLMQLAEERILVREVGLARDSAYVADLEVELNETRAAYAEAAILQLVLLRAELDGLNKG